MPLDITQNVLSTFLLALVWCLALGSEIWITRAGGPGSCKAKGVKAVKADIQAKELIGMVTARSTEWQTRVSYIALDYLCPSKIPDIGIAVDGYMSDVLTYQTMTDYCRANGYCPQTVDILAASRRSKLDQAALADLRNRGEIDEEQWYERMRELGWTIKPEADLQFLVSSWWPDPGQAISWYRHFTTDNGVAMDLQLDLRFQDMWETKPGEYLRGKGMSEEEALYLWRSSFQLPDLQTAFDLYRRGQAGLLPRNGQFGLRELDLAINASGIPPAMQDAYTALIYSPLGFRQLRGLYDEDVITEEQVVSNLTASGFSPTDAKLLMAEWKKLKPAYFRRKIGAAGAAQIGKEYAAGLLGEDELRHELDLDGFTQEEITQAVLIAKDERLRYHRQELIKFLKARYIKGEVDEAKVQAVLSSVGMQAEDIADLLRYWRVEFEVHPRQSSAAELLGWFKDGILSQSQLVSALSQLRYGSADIARMVAAAEYDIASENLKRAEKIVGAAEKGLNKDAKAWREQLKQAEKLYGTVEQRTVTQPGKLLDWVKKRVLKPAKPVSAMLGAGAEPGDLGAVNGKETEDFFIDPESQGPKPPAP